MLSDFGESPETGANLSVKSLDISTFLFLRKHQEFCGRAREPRKGGTGVTALACVCYEISMRMKKNYLTSKKYFRAYENKL